MIAGFGVRNHFCAKSIHCMNATLENVGCHYDFSSSHCGKGYSWQICHQVIKPIRFQCWKINSTNDRELIQPSSRWRVVLMSKNIMFVCFSHHTGCVGLAIGHSSLKWTAQGWGNGWIACVGTSYSMEKYYFYEWLYCFVAQYSSGPHRKCCVIPACNHDNLEIFTEYKNPPAFRSSGRYFGGQNFHGQCSSAFLTLQAFPSS